MRIPDQVQEIGQQLRPVSLEQVLRVVGHESVPNRMSPSGEEWGKFAAGYGNSAPESYRRRIPSEISMKPLAIALLLLLVPSFDSAVRVPVSTVSLRTKQDAPPRVLPEGPRSGRRAPRPAKDPRRQFPLRGASDEGRLGAAGGSPQAADPGRDRPSGRCPSGRR